MKSTLCFVAKLTLAGGLVAWLVLSGRLDFQALRILYQEPSLLAYDFALFLLGACIGSFRYQTLLRIADVRISFGKLFMLQMTAFFFNVVIP